MPVSTFTNDAGYLTTVPVTSVNTLTGDVVLTTTEVAEGTNEYYTDAKSRTAISLTTDSVNMVYDDVTGIFTYTNPVAGAPGPANRVELSSA